MVWWGARKGLDVSSLPSVKRPATECSSLASSVSSRVMGGKMEGSRFASMDLPAPGGPTIITLCPPAAAISSARFACSCPRTSEKSGRPSMSGSNGAHSP